MQHNIDLYLDFQNNRNLLFDLLREATTACANLEQKSWAEQLTSVRAKAASDQFKVMVVGNFKSGKSTFVNALLGESVLPMDVVPCTAVISEIKYRGKKEAVIYFRNPLPATMPPKLSRAALELINQAGGKTPPPTYLNIDQLKDFITIVDPENEKESMAESPYLSAEIFWPLPLCERGVEIIDSPGLNEAVTREQITTEYLKKADAVVFVMTCLALAGKNEVEYVQKDIRPFGHEDIFFVCNRYDQVTPASARGRVRENGNNKLAPFTALGEKGVFFLSSYQALEGRMANDESLVEQSGILPLESALSDFLVNKRAKVKLLVPARELNRALQHMLVEVIPAQRHLLDQTLASIEAKVRKAEPELQAARKAKDQIVSRICLHFDGLKRDLKYEAAGFLSQLADEIPEIVPRLQPEKNLSILSFRQAQHAKEYVQELLEKLEPEIQARIDEWKAKKIDPVFEASVKALGDELKGTVDLFYARIEGLQTDVLGLRTIRGPEMKGPSGTERFLASVTGLLLGDFVSGVQGAQTGFKGLWVAVGAQLAAVVGIILLGVVNPFATIGIMLGAGSIAAMIRLSGVKEQLKKKVGEEVANGFRKSMYAAIDKLQAKVDESATVVMESAAETLERDIRSIEEQVNAALKDKERGEEQVRGRRALLIEVEKACHAMDGKLDDFIMDLAQGGSGSAFVPSATT
jgi:GTPase SAR1 family protein